MVLHCQLIYLLSSMVYFPVILLILVVVTFSDFFSMIEKIFWVRCAIYIPYGLYFGKLMIFRIFKRKTSLDEERFLYCGRSRLAVVFIIFSRKKSTIHSSSFIYPRDYIYCPYSQKIIVIIIKIIAFGLYFLLFIYLKTSLLNN